MYRSLLQKGQSSKILGNPRLGDKQLQQPQSHEAIFRRSALHLTQQTPTKTMAKKTTMAATQCPRSSQASQAHGSDDVLPPLVACCALPPLVARTCDDNYTQDDEAKSIRGGAADELAGVVNWDPRLQRLVAADYDPLNLHNFLSCGFRDMQQNSPLSSVYATKMMKYTEIVWMKYTMIEYSRSQQSIG